MAPTKYRMRPSSAYDVWIIEKKVWYWPFWTYLASAWTEHGAKRKFEWYLNAQELVETKNKA